MISALSGVQMQGLWRDCSEFGDESQLCEGGGTERAEAASEHWQLRKAF